MVALGLALELGLVLEPVLPVHRRKQAPATLPISIQSAAFSLNNLLYFILLVPSGCRFRFNSPAHTMKY